MDNAAHRQIPGRAMKPLYVVRPELSGLRLILPALVLFYALLLPPEVRVTVADQVLTMPRIVGLALLPLVLQRFLNRTVGASALDLVYVLGAAWVVFALVMVTGPADGFTSGVGIALDLVLPYLVARTSIASMTDLRRFLVLAVPGLALVAASLLAEVVANQLIIRPFAAEIFGAVRDQAAGGTLEESGFYIDSRLGRIRAMGPFSHPIHAGVFLATFLPLYWMSGLRGWPKSTGLASSIFAVFSLSSGAFLMLLLGSLLVLADWLQRVVQFLTWKLMLAVGAAFLAVVEIASQNGVINILIRFTLDPGTARFRRLIWQYGSQSVIEHPWFGIAFASYERPVWMYTGSVDNHWLAIAIRSGLFPSIAMLIVAIGGVVLLARRSVLQTEVDRRMHVALAISVALLVIIGFSVAFFGNAQIWFYMLFAFAVSLGDPLAVGAKAPRRVPPAATTYRIGTARMSSGPGMRHGQPIAGNPGQAGRSRG